ncbi:hypothetical protein [Psychromonas sp. SP041]|uniref:hypothetical protein n=1 Tax=Psychromonas sp. SP041 TaxID=1365007 RepID=UPI0010C78DCB|nr:hypothetical protein [Psychromonas sp. SP041]
MVNHEELLGLIGNINSIYDVDITKEVIEIRHGMYEIGIRSKIDQGSVDLDLFDAMISYISSNTKVILEVDFKHDFVATDLVIEAQSTEYDISILPPEFTGEVPPEEWEEAWKLYSDKLCQYARAWLRQTNTSQQLYPVAGYVGYMVSEVFGHKPKTISEDPYIKSRFVDPIPLDIMDKIKDDLRIVIFEEFGGQDEFVIYANSLAITSAEYYADTVKQIEQEKELLKSKEDAENAENAELKMSEADSNLDLNAPEAEETVHDNSSGAQQDESILSKKKSGFSLKKILKMILK